MYLSVLIVFHKLALRPPNAGGSAPFPIYSSALISIHFLSTAAGTCWTGHHVFVLNTSLDCNGNQSTWRTCKLHRLTKNQIFFLFYPQNSMIFVSYSSFNLSITSASKTITFTVDVHLSVMWIAPSRAPRLTHMSHPSWILFVGSFLGCQRHFFPGSLITRSEQGEGGRRGSVIWRCHFIFTPPTHVSLHHSAEQQRVTSQVCPPNRTAHPTIHLIRRHVRSAKRYLSIAKKTCVRCSGFFIGLSLCVSKQYRLVSKVR